MKRLVIFFLVFIFIAGLSFARGPEDKPKILLLISEKNTNGELINWWVDETEFSAIEANLSKLLINLNCQAIEVKTALNIVKKDRSFKTANLAGNEALRLGRALRADYVVKGAAFVSAGSNIYSASGRPFFANAAVKLIRIKDGQVIADLDAIGSSVNMDTATGGKEALSNAAVDLAAKIISNITKEGGK